MAITVGSLQAIFTADTTAFDSAVGRVRSSLGGLGDTIGGSLQKVGGSLTSMGAQIGIGIAPLAGAFGLGVKAATEFDSVMAEISARAGLVGEDLQRVEAFALEMGAKTAFSAQQAADAFLQLLTSGQTAEEAIATLPMVLDAAAASGAGLGQAADLVTDIMAAFGLQIDSLTPDVRAAADAMGITAEQIAAIAREGDVGNATINKLAEATGRTNDELLRMMQAEDAVDVVNALAKAAGASSADMMSLGQGFSNVGPVARMYGLTVERTAAALAVLSENGIKGAEAGTALKSMLLNMTRPTADVLEAWDALGVSFYDAEGNTRDLAVVLREMDDALNSGRFTAQEKNEIIKALGGSYGATALSALMAGDAIGKMESMMADAATAEEVAAARMNTFAGAMEAMKGSLETLSIRVLRPFMNNTLRPLVDVVTGAINVFADWAAEHPELVTAVGALTLGLTGLSGTMLALGPVIAFLGAGIGALLSPIGLAVAAIGGLAIALQTNFLGIGDIVRDFVGSIRAAFDQGGLEGVLGVVWERIKAGAINAAAWVKDNIVVPVVDALKTADWSEVPGQIGAILGQFVEGAETVGAWVGDNIITPAVEYLRGVDWGEVGSRLGDLLDKFLGLAAAGITGMGVWLWDNIVGPAVDYLKNVNWSNQVSRLGDLLEKFLGLAAAGIVSVGVWLWDNIVGPAVDYLKNVNWSNQVSRLGDLLDKFLGLAAAGITGVGVWLWDNVVGPAVDYLKNVNWGEVDNKLLGLLEQLLGFAGAGLESVGTWAWDNVIQPVINTLTSAETWDAVFNAAMDLGQKLFDGLISALQGLPGRLADLILGAIPSDVHLGPAGSIHIGGRGAAIGWGGEESRPDVAGGAPRSFGRAGGGPFRMRVGEHGPEEIVLTSPLSGQVIPNSEVRRRESARGVVINGGTFVLQGVTDTQRLYDELQRVAMRRA